MGSITSANAVLMLAVTNLFPAPQQLQGFSADDIFDTDPVAITQAVMGVDGVQSAGLVYNPILQNIVLQADSQSNKMFSDWVQAMKIAQDVYWAQATVLLTSIGRKFTMSNGTLTMYPPTPRVAKILQPQRYTISWESVVPQDV